MSAIIRAVYKELHYKGDYAKGKPIGVPRTHTLASQRARQGRTLIFELDHLSTLEDFPWTVLRSQEIIAFTRACMLIEVLILRHLRWLAGKAAQLTGWPPVEMGWAYALLEEAMIAAVENVYTF
eukprot:6209371-Pleurochrysis_carterae.AAC.2